MGYLVKNVNISVTMSLTALMTFGLWLPRNTTGNKRLLYNCYGLFCFMFAMGLYIICQVIDLFLNWGDLPKMTATACLLFTNFAHFSKIVNVIVRRPLIQTIVDNAHLDLTSETSDEGKEIMNRCNFETKWQHFMYHIVTWTTLIGWGAGPVKGQLPVPSWYVYPQNSTYPIDVSKSPAYEIAYTHQVVAVFMSGYLNVSKDALVATLIAQCQCRLRLLGLSLRTICNDINIPGQRLLSQDQEKVVKSRLRVCVTRHQAALEAADQLQQAFSEPTFIQFTISLVIICVTGFQMVSQTGNMVRMLSMVSYLLNMMYQLFIYCYQGNQLAEESMAVAEAVYEVPWYACRSPVRCALVVMSVRSRRSALLVAGGFTPLTLTSFTSIIKASYSMFTLLQQVEERN